MPKFSGKRCEITVGDMAEPLPRVADAPMYVERVPDTSQPISIKAERVVVNGRAVRRIFRIPKNILKEFGVSSPTNVVVTITGIDGISGTATVRELAAEHRGRLVPDGGKATFYHHDACLWDFYTQAVDSIREGAEGAMLAWGTVGNHVDDLEFMRRFFEFMCDVIAIERFACATVMFQTHDEGAIVHQVSRHLGQIRQTRNELWNAVRPVTPGVGPVLRIDPKTPFSLDVDLDHIEAPPTPEAPPLAVETQSTQTVECPDCHGRGETGAGQAVMGCPACGGSGSVPADAT